MTILKKLTQLEKEAEEFGFKWEYPEQILNQIQSECEEIKVHLHQNNDEKAKQKLQEEIGDLLHAVCSLCVFCQFDPEETLEKSTAKFARRLKAVKEIANANGFNSLNGCQFSELMNFWNKAKERVG